MSLQCCGNFDTFYAPELPGNAAFLAPVCSDLLNATVQIIVAQRNSEGLAALEIWNQLPVVCMELAMNSNFEELEAAIAFGKRRGVLCLTYRPSDSAEAYLVNGKMTLVNPLNVQYTRSVCDFYSSKFTRPRGPSDHPDCLPCAEEVVLNSKCDPCIENSF